jgi:hypothetical protein
MSSETSTNRDQLHPWQFFTLAGLAGATAVVFVAREPTPAAVVLLSLTVIAAAFVGLAAWRTMGPLAGAEMDPATQVVGGRTRAALEREKTLVLRSIKDLEFDRAMGKVSDKDFAEMSARLRTRASGLLRQLDRGSTYRDAIEHELARRLNLPNNSRQPAAPKAVAEGEACVCGTRNDADARFCKNCGRKLHE